MKIQAIIIIGLIFSSNIYGQFHKCTTDHEPLIERIEANKARIASNTVDNRAGDPLYAPMKFHRVGKTEGTSYMAITSILDNMCKLGKDYSKFSDIVPYINGDFPKLNSSTVFNQPYLNSSANQMTNATDNQSINVFIVGNVDQEGGNGTTLGYYDPSRDFLVMRQLELLDTTSTLSHELGHYFSLMHPFFGWESSAYTVSIHGNPLNSTVISGTNIEVEMVDRARNCSYTGDRICDTPASYLFGFSDGSTTIGNCELAPNIYDFYGDLLEPMENNMMDYFPDCEEYVFTEQQAEVMHADFNSPYRAIIRSSYIPNINEITSAPTQLSPSTGDLIESYNSIVFEWEAIEHADQYLVEVQDVFVGTKYEYLTDSPNLWVTDLEPNKKYAWFVHPFNETSACYKSSKKIFDTGDSVTAVDEIKGISTFAIYPNPIYESDKVTVAIESDNQKSIDISVVSIDGKTVLKTTQTINTGANEVKLKLPQQQGIYFIQLQSENGVLTKRVIKQ